MRLCVRLAVLAGLLVAVAIGLIALRTDVHHSGNRLHALFREKRHLEQQCCRLELEVARLRSQDSLRDRAVILRRAFDETPAPNPPALEASGGARPVPDRAPAGPPRRPTTPRG